MIKSILSFFPRNWKVRKETEIVEATKIDTRLSALEPSIQFFIDRGVPTDAAWDAALQLSGVPNAKSVLSRLSESDWERLPSALVKSEAINDAFHATRTASNESLQDLLARIIKGELEEPGGAPRSAMQVVNRIGKSDLEIFLKLRRVLWKECDQVWGNSQSTIYCLPDLRSYPGLLDSSELRRLVDLGLVRFGAMAFESTFPGAKAGKWLSFGDKKIMVTNSQPDATLHLGHYALTSDSKYIIDLYGDPCEMLYDHFDGVCDEWRRQGFNVTDVQVIGLSG